MTRNKAFIVSISWEEGEILLALKENAGVMGTGEISLIVQNSSSNTSRRLNRLYLDGYLINVKRGVWDLSSLGFRLAEFIEDTELKNIREKGRSEEST